MISTSNREAEVCVRREPFAGDSVGEGIDVRKDEVMEACEEKSPSGGKV